MIEFIRTGADLAITEKAKLYVAMTRATHIVGIIVPNSFKANFINVPFWSKEC